MHQQFGSVLGVGDPRRRVSLPSLGALCWKVMEGASCSGRPLSVNPLGCLDKGSM